MDRGALLGYSPGVERVAHRKTQHLFRWRINHLSNSLLNYDTNHQQMQDQTTLPMILART